MKLSISLCCSLLPLALAHFELVYPAQREADSSEQGEFPCSGADSPSEERTDWSLQGDRIELKLGHSRAYLQVLLAVGNEPGENFNVELLPTVLQEGMGTLCLDDLQVPEGVEVSDGTNATIQIAMDGETGLYNCADITFRDAPAEAGSCTNATGMTTEPLAEPINANSSSPDGDSPHMGGDSMDHSDDDDDDDDDSEEASETTAAVAEATTNAAHRNGFNLAMAGAAAGMFGYAAVLV